MSCHRFGPFLLYASRRQLFEGEREVRLGARALDLLIALLERSGAVVSKQELMALVWPHEVVEENTLRVHMAALRKVLAANDREARYITNIAGRGYSFVAPAVTMAPPPMDLPVTAAPVLPVAPPAPLAVPRLDCTLLGRAETLDVLDGQLARYGFVTLAGPGGIGKTSVAIAVSRQAAARYRDGVWFVDLSTLPTGAGAVDVVLAIARVVGVHGGIEGLYERLSARLGGGAHLLVLDNCEHVVKGVASAVTQLLAPTPGLHLLVTSREPLRVVGEQVHLLPCLPMPDTPVQSLAQALRWPAIELFVQRARSSDQTFEPGDADAVWIAHICHGLDGVPLAIEHAAAMVRTFGLKALAASLDDRFLLLCGAHRNAISRHQNLEALLRWGYDLLTPTEQRVLRWLSVMRGAMPLSDILTLASPDLMERHELLEAVHGLVLKSWLFPRPGGDLPAYRMHAMARSFAHQMLMAGGESAAFGLRPRTPEALAPPPRAAVAKRPWVHG